MNTQSLIQSLRLERIGYVQRGRMDRVADVDALLLRLGAEVETASIQPQVETAARQKPTRRKKG
jgi:hypothetical protein